MKQQWVAEELLQRWTLSASEETFINNYQTDTNRLGCALLLKYAQNDGKFPGRKQDIPLPIVEYIAQQLSVPSSSFDTYQWRGGTNDRHRLHIRRVLEIRIGTVSDAKEITTWLARHIILQEQRHFEQLKKMSYERYRELKIEPPQPKRIERLTRSALRTADEQFYAATAGRLSQDIRARLDALLDPAANADGTAAPASVLQGLRSEAGPNSLESVFAEIQKLRYIRSLGLPPDLFFKASGKVVTWYRARVAVEDVREIRRHPAAIRYTLLATYCVQREGEIIDTLIDLLINLISIQRPQGTVKDVIYPVAPEQMLRSLVEEFRSGGSYEHKVQVLMRGSYSNHYRRMVPLVLKALDFSSTSTAPKPLLAALDLIRKYADTNQAFYPETEDIPLDGIVPDSWLPLVKQGQRVNRISYELCVLKVPREKIRCKEIYVIGASRYRNPDENLPQDFSEKRNDYYVEFDLPLSADEFIAKQQHEMTEALETFDRCLPKNKYVAITTRNGKSWIKVASLDPQPEPKNLTGLKAEVGRRWGQLFLLDVLKETALRSGFPNFFKSPALYETLPRDILQVRLILCLYALGTNIGLKRIVSGLMEKYRDLLYIRNRYINKDSLRAAIAAIANAILRERKTQIWGQATSCAGDSKKFGAYDQNLLTEWHVRYRGPGIMVYWHVEKKALCIYSQIKRCSSSEVASMIQGLLRHCADMEVQKGFVDTHGQSFVGFAFTHLLGIALMPRLADWAGGSSTVRRPVCLMPIPICSLSLRAQLIGS